MQFKTEGSGAYLVVMELVVLLHDNRQPHVACSTQDLIMQFSWIHLPYSLDFVLSDYYKFLHLKQSLAVNAMMLKTNFINFLCQNSTFFKDTTL